MESIADLAIRTALSSRGVAHITIPVDVQVQEMKKGRSERNPVHHTSAASAYLEQLPSRVEIEHAANILNRGKKIAILAGARRTPRNAGVGGDRGDAGALLLSKASRKGNRSGRQPPYNWGIGLL